VAAAAIDHKHLPDVEVASAGVWRTARTLMAVYQQGDAETMLRVVLEAGAPGEARWPPGLAHLVPTPRDVADRRGKKSAPSLEGVSKGA